MVKDFRTVSPVGRGVLNRNGDEGTSGVWDAPSLDLGVAACKQSSACALVELPTHSVAPVTRAEKVRFRNGIGGLS